MCLSCFCTSQRVDWSSLRKIPPCSIYPPTLLPPPPALAKNVLPILSPLQSASWRVNPSWVIVKRSVPGSLPERCSCVVLGTRFGE